MLSEAETPRMTKWVLRLLIINAVVLLLQQTIVTSDALGNWLAFDPALVAQRPWTVFTYMFLHAGLLHLAANSLALVVFGPAVERRFGGSSFVAFYIYCGIGAAIFTLMLHSLGVAVPGFIGASGAIMGVILAFVRWNPDAVLMLLLVPVPIRARWLIPLIAAYDLAGMIVPFHDNIAHSAHIGGLLAGAFYFILRGIAHPPETIAIAPPRPRVPVGTSGGGNRGGGIGGGGRTHTTAQLPTSAPTPRSAANNPDLRMNQASARAAQARESERVETAELDRLLDKISESGIDSLTPDEHRFLDGVARRRRHDTT